MTNNSTNNRKFILWLIPVGLIILGVILFLFRSQLFVSSTSNVLDNEPTLPLATNTPKPKATEEPLPTDELVEETTLHFTPDDFGLSPDTVIDIPDDNLKDCLIIALENKGDIVDCDITIENLLSLTQFSVASSEIYNERYDNYEYPANVSEIILNENKISSLEGLQYAKNLEYLIIDDQEISHISVLEDLTDLKLLYISRNSISDISALKNLTNLEFLRFACNKTKVLDESPLYELVNLKALSIYDTDVIIDFEQMHKATKMIDLDFGGVPVINFNNVEVMTDLFQLCIPSCGIEDISDVTKLENLERLLLDYSTYKENQDIVEQLINNGCEIFHDQEDIT